MAGHVWTDVVEQILSGEPEQHPPQGDVRSDPVEQGIQLFHGLPAHRPGGAGRVPVRSAVRVQTVGYVSGLRGWIEHLFRVEDEMPQSEYLQAGVPQIGHGRGLALDTVGGGRGEDAFAVAGCHIPLEAGKGVQFLYLPVEFTRAERRQGMDQCGQVDITAMDGGAGGLEQPLARVQPLFRCDDGQQVVDGDAALAEELAVSFLRQIAVGAGEFPGHGQGIGEFQMLVAVQGVVVDEIPDRCLTRQDVLQVFDGLADLRPDVA